MTKNLGYLDAMEMAPMAEVAMKWRSVAVKLT
jgi:hypothetical protein